MLTRSLRAVILFVAVLLSMPLRAQEQPVEPTVEQLKKAKDDFAKIGATYRLVTDTLTKRSMHWFEFAPTTKNADLKKLPNPPFPFNMSLGFTNVTDMGLIELKDLKNLTVLYVYRTKVTDGGMKELKVALPKCKIER